MSTSTPSSPRAEKRRLRNSKDDSNTTAVAYYVYVITANKKVKQKQITFYLDAEGKLMQKNFPVFKTEKEAQEYLDSKKEKDGN